MTNSIVLALSPVVHIAVALPEIPGAPSHPNLAHQEKSILQDLPYHAPDNDCPLVLHALPRCRLFPPHEPNDTVNSA